MKRFWQTGDLPTDSLEDWCANEVKLAVEDFVNELSISVMPSNGSLSVSAFSWEVEDGNLMGKTVDLYEQIAEMFSALRMEDRMTYCESLEGMAARLRELSRKMESPH